MVDFVRGRKVLSFLALRRFQLSAVYTALSAKAWCALRSEAPRCSWHTGCLSSRKEHEETFQNDEFEFPPTS